MHQTSEERKRRRSPQNSALGGGPYPNWLADTAPRYCPGCNADVEQPSEATLLRQEAGGFRLPAEWYLVCAACGWEGTVARDAPPEAEERQEVVAFRQAQEAEIRRAVASERERAERAEALAEQTRGYWMDAVGRHNELAQQLTETGNQRRFFLEQFGLTLYAQARKAEAAAQPPPDPAPESDEPARD